MWDTSEYPELSYYEKYALKFRFNDLDQVFTRIGRKKGIAYNKNIMSDLKRFSAETSIIV